MNKFTISFFVICVLIGGFFFLNKDPKIINQNSTGTDIIAFGDSLVAGVGGEEGGFIKILENEIGKKIINLGVSGNTTADGIARIDSLDEYNPKIVILLLGGNDYLRKVPKADVFRNLGEIIDGIHSRGSMVLLLGVQGSILGDNYKKDFAKLAKEKNVAYVPNVLEGIIHDRRLMSDSIHPNQMGYEIIAQKVLPVLRDMLK